MFPEGKDEISRLSVSHSDIFSAETNYNSFKFIFTETVWLNLLYFWFSILCLPRAIFVNIINGSNAIHYLLWNKMFIICSIFRTPLAYFLHHTLRLSLNILWSLRRWSSSFFSGVGYEWFSSTHIYWASTVYWMVVGCMLMIKPWKLPFVCSGTYKFIPL